MELAEIELAYFNIAKEFHPDTNKTLDARQVFALIVEANDVLSDEARRTRYDKTGLSEERFGGYPSVDHQVPVAIKIGDLKLLTAHLTLSGTSGYHSCPFCTGFRKGKKGEKKRWVVGNQRTFRRLMEKLQQFLDPKGEKGDIKNASKYENVIHMPIRLSLGNDDRPLIHEFAPGPLHCMLLGKYSILFV